MWDTDITTNPFVPPLRCSVAEEPAFEEETTLPHPILRQVTWVAGTSSGPFTSEAAHETAETPSAGPRTRWPYWLAGALVGSVIGGLALTVMFDAAPRPKTVVFSQPDDPAPGVVCLPLDDANVEPDRPRETDGTHETHETHTRVRLRSAPRRGRPTGRLAIKAEPWARIYVDGRPLNRMSVAPL